MAPVAAVSGTVATTCVSDQLTMVAVAAVALETGDRKP